jgi:hypothetical protein
VPCKRQDGGGGTISYLASGGQGSSRSSTLLKKHSDEIEALF